MRTFYLAICVLFLSLVSLPILAGELQLFRWNTGYRAETTPTLTMKVTDKELEEFLRSQRLPKEGQHSAGLYTGCYMAVYDRQKEGRKLASNVGSIQPKSEVHRVCVPYPRVEK